MKADIFAGSLMPLADSTPPLTSTAKGRTRRIASATLSGLQSPRQDDGHAQLAGDATPVEGLAGPPREDGVVGIEQEPRRPPIGSGLGRQIKARPHADRLDPASSQARAELRPLFAVELEQVQGDAIEDSADLGLGGIHEESDGGHEGRQQGAQSRRLIRRHGPGARRMEHQTDGVGAGPHGRLHILRPRQTANFNPGSRHGRAARQVRLDSSANERE